MIKPVDPVEFTKLFRHRSRNFEAIAIGIRKIVASVARAGFYFPTQDDREEAEARAVLYAIERIDRFAAGRANAFAYYFSMARKCFLDQRRQAARLSKRATTFTDCSGADQTTARPYALAS